MRRRRPAYHRQARDFTHYAGAYSEPTCLPAKVGSKAGSTKITHACLRSSRIPEQNEASAVAWSGPRWTESGFGAAGSLRKTEQAKVREMASPRFSTVCHADREGRKSPLAGRLLGVLIHGGMKANRAFLRVRGLIRQRLLQLGSLTEALELLSEAFTLGDAKALKLRALVEPDLQPLWESS